MKKLLGLAFLAWIGLTQVAQGYQNERIVRQIGRDLIEVNTGADEVFPTMGGNKIWFLTTTDGVFLRLRFFPHYARFDSGFLLTYEERHKHYKLPKNACDVAGFVSDVSTFTRGFFERYE